ncbi:MAG: aldo/keto reductase [Mycobacteriales bacterium]
MTEQARYGRRLSSSSDDVSGLVLGTAALGNLFEPVDDDRVRETIASAWHSGVRSFDTAPHYGLGLAERRLGEAIRMLDLPRAELVISTKVGRILEPLDDVVGEDDEGYAVPRTHQRRWDFGPAGIRRSLDESCARLGVDHVDVALLHDPDDHMQQAIREGYPALSSLRAEGRIAAIGAGMNSAPRLARLVAECDLDVVMIAGRYSLLDQSALDDLLPTASARGTKVVVAGVFNSGLLAHASPRADATYDYAAAPPVLVERARQLALVCESFGVSLPQAALQFPLGHSAVAAIALGARTPQELQADLGLLSAPVPAELWDRLRETGLIRSDAPSPPTR